MQVYLCRYNAPVATIKILMLQAKALTCERDHRVLFSDLSFSLEAGEALSVEGGNGAGKSTLLRILAGLYEEFDGEVDWQLEHYPLYIGHKTGVKDLMTARENLDWCAHLYDMRVTPDAINDALAKVAMQGYEEVQCGAMSEGQRKRVNLARLFLLHNPVWILDEPFSAIDRAGVATLEAHLASHLAADGAVILTSHQAVSFAKTQTVDLSQS